MGRKASATLVKEFLEYCRVHRGRTPRTLYSYAKTYKMLLDTLGSTHVSDASVADLRGFVAQPIRKGKRGAGMEPSAATKKRKVAELRSLYKWLHGEGYAASNPALKLEAPPVDDENPRPINEDVWRTLWASDLTDSDRVAFGLGLFCGLRRFEITSLTPLHFVDVPKPMIAAFVRKGGKARNLPWLSCVRFFAERRPELIGGDAGTFVRPLQRLRAGRAGKLALLDWTELLDMRRAHPHKLQRPEGFVDPLQFNRRFERSLDAAGLAPDAATPHMLRHGFCTFLLDAGVPLLDVSRLAGHANVTMTQRYLKTREDPLARLLDESDDDGDEGLAAFSPWA